ncbi:MAG: hypothetical protein ACE5I5_19580 [Candidatus Heimdallarchaeota archaeon]
MNCPECGRPLFYGGEVAAGTAPEGQPIKEEIKRKKFKCTNKKCPKYDQIVTWDDKAKKWIS